MAEKQVRIDLVAQDHASAKVRDVAEEVEDLEEAVKDLDKLDPEIEVEADTRKAESNLEEVADDIKDIQRQDNTFVLEARVSDAKAALKDAQGELDKVKDKAVLAEKAVDDIGRAQGPRLAGNTVADLTGPLGEASGVAGDVGGVFDGLGDSAESAWIKMGGGEQGASRIASAFGFAGFAVAGVTAAWSMYRQGQQKAEEQQKKLVDGIEKINEALAKGEHRDAAEQMVSDYEDAYKMVGKFGITANQVTRYLQGQDVQLGNLNDALDASTKEYGYWTGAAEDTITTLQEQRQGYIDANGTLATHEELVDGVTASLSSNKDATEDAADATARHEREVQEAASAQERLKIKTDRTKDAMDRLKGTLDMERALLRFSADFQAAHDKVIGGTKLTSEEILDLKQDIFDVAEFADLNPVEVQSLLDRITAGDYLGVKSDVEMYSATNQAKIATSLQQPPLSAFMAELTRRLGRGIGSGGASRGSDNPGAGGVMYTPPAPGVTVYQSVPRGYRGDVLADAQAAARRSGGLYQRSRR